MLFRLLSAIGAFAHLGDAIVAPFLKFKNQPTKLRAGGARIAGALAFAVIFVICGSIALTSANEGSTNAAPTSYTVTQLATATDLGGKTYVTVTGYIYPYTVTTSIDNKYDHTSYFLVDNPDGGTGVIVQSKLRDTDIEKLVTADGELTVTGMIRDDSKEISGTLDTAGSHVDAAWTITKKYLVREGDKPADPGVLYPIAAVCGVLAALLLVGWGIRYLVFRPAHTVQRFATSGMSATIPVRVTGLIPGLVNGTRAREMVADLRLGDVVEGDPSAMVGAPQPVDLVWMAGKQITGVRLAPGVSKVEMGTAYPLRGAKPAVRVKFGTFNLILTFADQPARDAAFDQLRTSAGLALAPSSVAATATA